MFYHIVESTVNHPFLLGVISRRGFEDMDDHSFFLFFERHAAERQCQGSVGGKSGVVPIRRVFSAGEKALSSTVKRSGLTG